MSKKTQSLVLGIMCIMLTMLICIQIKTVNTNGSTVTRNQEENELRSQVLKMKEKYEIAYSNLQDAEKELEETRQNVTSNNEELKELEEKIKKASQLIGLTDVEGTGVTITVTDAVINKNSLSPWEDPSKFIVHNVDILDIINELKNAGAEAIDVNGQRIVNTSAVVCDGNIISINGEKVNSTFTINAIGLPELMATLNNRNGGILPNLEAYQIQTTFKKLDKVNIPKYTGVLKFKYAKTIS